MASKKELKQQIAELQAQIAELQGKAPKQEKDYDPIEMFFRTASGAVKPEKKDAKRHIKVKHEGFYPAGTTRSFIMECF